MNKLIFAFLTLFSFHASAYIASQEDVLKVCTTSFSGDYDQNRCFAQVRGHHYDTGALAICSSNFSGSYDVSKCLDAIKDIGFDANALAICKKESTSYDTSKCLSAIAHKSYVPAEVAFCAQRSTSYDIGRCMAGLAVTPLRLTAAPAAPSAPPACMDPDSVAVIRGKLLQALRDINANHFDQAAANIRSALSDM